MGIHLLLEGTTGPLGERQQEILEVCREDTARLDRLMRELLDLSKIESGAVTPVFAPIRPSTLIARGHRPAAPAGGIAWHPPGRRRAAGPSDVSVDRSQIERVITNLVTNATRATPAGGAITVAAAPRGEEIAISVADTGSGIPREYLSRIFEPFVQVPHATGGGAGLGLTISRRIVEAHGGQLTVQSIAGTGLDIHVYCAPVADGGTAHESARSSTMNRTSGR